MRSARASTAAAAAPGRAARALIRCSRLGSFAALLAGCVAPPDSMAEAQSWAAIADSVRLPDSPTGRHYPRFLEAYNSGRLDGLRRFFTEVTGDSSRGARFAAYWKGVHNEYGPVTLELIDTSRQLPWYWVRGRVTRAWSVFVVGFSDGADPRLTDVGVVRGVLPPGHRPPPAIAADRLPDVLDEYLAASAAGGHFSGVVTVAKDGNVLFERAYGKADERHDIPNRLDTRFPIASMTKMLTAIALLQLVERGEVELSDPLGKFVPEYPEPIRSRVTVRHLLTHTSGIELDDWEPYNREIQLARSVEDMLEAQLRHIEHLNGGPPAGFELPDEFDYTNEGYDLIGVIVKRVSGRSWPEYVREHVLVPAGMRGTGFSHDVPVPGLATGYTRGSDHPEGRRSENDSLLSPYARPSGNMYSTAADMVRFLDAVRAGRLLGPELTRAATSPQVAWTGRDGAHYGFGFEIVVAGGVRYFGHGGSQPGVSTRGFVYPELGYVVAVLSNYDEAAPHVAAHVHELIARTAERDR